MNIRRKRERQKGIGYREKVIGFRVEKDRGK
jgi:hypothetical protein